MPWCIAITLSSKHYRANQRKLISAARLVTQPRGKCTESHCRSFLSVFPAPCTTRHPCRIKRIIAQIFVDILREIPQLCKLIAMSPVLKIESTISAFKKRTKLGTKGKFSNFGELPTELRLAIWHFAGLETCFNPANDNENGNGRPQRNIIPGSNEARRTHRITCVSTLLPWKRYRNGKPRHAGSELVATNRSKTHPLLRTCQESRHKTIKMYGLSFAFGTWVNFEKDIFCFDFTFEGIPFQYCRQNGIHPVLEIPQFTSQIKHLALKVYKVPRYWYRDERVGRSWTSDGPPRAQLMKEEFTSLENLVFVQTEKEIPRSSTHQNNARLIAAKDIWATLATRKRCKKLAPAFYIVDYGINDPLWESQIDMLRARVDRLQDMSDCSRRRAIFTVALETLVGRAGLLSVERVIYHICHLLELNGT